MNKTNLNITYNGSETSHKYNLKYVVTYDKNTGSVDTDVTMPYYVKDGNVVFFNSRFTNVSPYKNYWVDADGSTSTAYVPANHSTAAVTLFFPRHSVETYKRNVHYVLTINTWIGSTPVFLGSYVVRRTDALASSAGPQRFFNTDYYESVSFEVPDVNDMMYLDVWRDFRTKVCDERISATSAQVNNTCATLSFTLNVVDAVDDVYVRDDSCSSSQSAMITQDTGVNTYLHVNNEFVTSTTGTSFNASIKFNDAYNGDLTTYLNETYLIDTQYITLKYLLILRDKENIYNLLTYDAASLGETSHSFSADDLLLTDWSQFTEGMYVDVLVTLNNSSDGSEMMFTSNSVFITQEHFSRMMNSSIKYVNLNNINMNNINFNLINKIENKIVQISRPDDYKSNIVSPVFVRVQDAASINIHRNVTENIVINLDAYKNKVSMFTIKIGDTIFYETARIASGVVFKITGTNLSDDTTGVYYILNDSSELVTTGKYTII